MTATLVLRGLPGYRGEANLYRVDPPLAGHELVVVTTTRQGRGGTPVTAVHAADGSHAWLPGSQRNAYGHVAALLRAGYTRIVEQALAPPCLICHRGTGILVAVTADELTWRCQREDCRADFTSDRDGFVGWLRKWRHQQQEEEQAARPPAVVPVAPPRVVPATGLHRYEDLALSRQMQADRSIRYIVYRLVDDGAVETNLFIDRDRWERDPGERYKLFLAGVWQTGGFLPGGSYCAKQIAGFPHLAEAVGWARRQLDANSPGALDT